MISEAALQACFRKTCSKKSYEVTTTESQIESLKPIFKFTKNVSTKCVFLGILRNVQNSLSVQHLKHRLQISLLIPSELLFTTKSPGGPSNLLNIKSEISVEHLMNTFNDDHTFCEVLRLLVVFSLSHKSLPLLEEITCQAIYRE